MSAQSNLGSLHNLATLSFQEGKIYLIHAATDKLSRERVEDVLNNKVQRHTADSPDRKFMWFSGIVPGYIHKCPSDTQFHVLAIQKKSLLKLLSSKAAFISIAKKGQLSKVTNAEYTALLKHSEVGVIGIQWPAVTQMIASGQLNLVGGRPFLSKQPQTQKAMKYLLGNLTSHNFRTLQLNNLRPLMSADEIEDLSIGEWSYFQALFDIPEMDKGSRKERPYR